MASRYIMEHSEGLVQDVALMIDEIAWQQSAPPLCIEVAEQIVQLVRNSTPVDFARVAHNLDMHTEHAVDYYRTVL